MKKMHVYKLIVNVIMTLGFILMFNKSVLGQQFHEYGGLAVIALFIVHAAVNYKWILGVTRNLFAKKLPAKTRIGYALDILLVLCVVVIALSGLSIAKVLPFGIAAGNANVWKQLHVSVSCLTLALSGLHLGLHIDWVCGAFKRIFKIGRTIAPLNWALVGISVILIAYGVFSFASTSYLRHLSGITSVFGATDAQGRQQGEGQQGERTPPANDEKMKEGNPSDGEGRMQAGQPGGAQQISISGVLSTILSYASIMSVFAAITFLLDKLVFARRARQAYV